MRYLIPLLLILLATPAFAGDPVGLEMAFWGKLVVEQNNGSEAIVWELSDTEYPLVCQEPYITVDDCGVQGIFDEICGSGHIDYYEGPPFGPGLHIFVDELTPCP